MATHHNIAHLGRRDFVCPHEHCRRAFGYKHLLQRHLAKLHAPELPSDPESCHETDRIETEPESPTVSTRHVDIGMDIDLLTGKAYSAHAKEAIQHASKLRCPFPDLPPILSGQDTSSAVASGSKRPVDCQYVFSRAYDLRRHLQAEHGVIVGRDSADQWVRSEKETREAIAQ